MTRNVLSCPECHEELQTIDYKMWGTKRFNPVVGGYEEDESPGNCDLIFACPHCDVKLDPDVAFA